MGEAYFDSYQNVCPLHPAQQTHTDLTTLVCGPIWSTSLNYMPSLTSCRGFVLSLIVAFDSTLYLLKRGAFDSTFISLNVGQVLNPTVHST